MSRACIFCRIVSDDAPRSAVFEDDEVLAFMDILPVNPGHLLIVPKQHVVYLDDLPESTGARVMRVAMRLARAIRDGELAPDGINLFLADGEAAGQEVFHSHLHVIPRFRRDGFHLRVDYKPSPDRTLLDQHAEIIRAALSG